MTLPVRSLYRSSLVLLPLFVAIVTPALGRAWCFHMEGMSWPAALGYSAMQFLDMVHEIGTLATILLVMGNLASFGVLIVVSVLASCYWNPKRVYCMLACGLLSAAAYWAWTSPYLTYWAEVAERGVVTPAVFYWPREIFQYNVYALLGIPIGALVALLPIFRPGKRYWLRRGMCPTCQYDLQHKIDQGCPECGWNRDEACPALPADHAVARRGD